MLSSRFKRTIPAATAALCVGAVVTAVWSQHPASAAPATTNFSIDASANDAATVMAVKILGQAKSDPSFGNVRVVPGGLQIDVVGGTSSAVSSVVSLSQGLFDGLKIPVTYRTVQRSLASLEALKDQIMKDQQSWFDQGIFMTTYGPDMSSNRVLVTLRDYTPEAAAAITAKYGDSVTVSTQSDAAEMLTNRFADSQPWFGGDRIDIPQPDGSVNLCTSYFSLYSTQNSAAYNATAGHCGQGQALNNGVLQGNIVSSRVMWHNGGSTDVELWQVGSNGGDVWHSNLFRGVTSRSTGESIGTSVCQDGMMTGESCGDVVQNPDITINEYDENGVFQATMQHQVQTQNAYGLQAGQHGDSGAPVYAIKSNGEAEAYGMLIAGTGTQMYYTPQRNIFGVYSAGLTFEPTVH